MPGINLVIDPKGNLKDQESRIIQIQKSFMQREDYFEEVLFFESIYFLGCVRYSNYPINIFENSRFFICIEGRIYNKDNSVIEKELNEIAEMIFFGKAYQKDFIKSWLLNSDGDFIVIILDKTSKDAIIINDALGRLPLYFCERNAQLVVSRKMQFITSFVEKVEFDKAAIAEYLLFGFPLGKKTFFKNIFRLQPATLIRINSLKSEINIDNIHTFNFENKRYKGKSIKNNADQLIKLFLTSCKNRANSIDNCKNVLSLSGGLDSRAVAVGLQQSGITFSGATMLDFDGKYYKSDVILAEQIAQVLKIDWKLFQLDPPKGKDLLNCLKIKDGLVHLKMSFIHSFFDKIRKTYGSRIAYFTGDEGNKVFLDYTPPKKIKSLDALVDYIIQENYVFDLNDVKALTGIGKKEIKDKIKKHVERYPENNLSQKYVHFVYYEHASKFAFEGEDRNRFYFWSVAPLYSIHFFDYVMNCPDTQKKYYKLYRSFLLILSPKVSALPNASWGFSITSIKCALYLRTKYIYQRYARKLRKKIKKKTNLTYKKYEFSQEVKNCIFEQMATCHPIPEYFSDIELRNLIGRGFSLNQLYNLLTIVSYIELTECGLSTLEKYIESDFP